MLSRSLARARWACVIMTTLIAVVYAGTCGNGVVESGEQCDAGSSGSEGCTTLCRVVTGYVCVGSPSQCIPRCGDGLIVGVESCDDSNYIDGDGCSSACTIEPDWHCNGAPSVCQRCGDGVLQGTEMQAGHCDDNNTLDNDGCSSTCMVEIGWTCGGAPSHCAAICGDGLVRGTEVCDGSSCCTPSCTFKTDGVSCVGDNNTCTVDTCLAGVCTAAPAYTCTVSACLSNNVCDGYGGCISTPKPDGVSCVYDANACTVDTCQAGVCVAAPPYACVAADCDSSSTCDGFGGCDVVSKANGTRCHDLDGDACTPATCWAGACTEGPAHPCVQGTCHASATCDGAGGCVFVPRPDGETCPDTDGDACTVQTCSAGACVAAAPYSCTPGSCHANATCDGVGGCLFAPLPDGTGCPDVDGNACTVETCRAGTCASGTPYTCVAQPCESATCDGLGGCNSALLSGGAQCKLAGNATFCGTCSALGDCNGCMDPPPRPPPPPPPPAAPASTDATGATGTTGASGGSSPSSGTTTAATGGNTGPATGQSTSSATSGTSSVSPSTTTSGGGASATAPASTTGTPDSTSDSTSDSASDSASGDGTASGSATGATSGVYSTTSDAVNSIQEAPPAASSTSSVNLVAIILPVALVLLLSIGCLTLFVLLRRRRRNVQVDRKVPEPPGTPYSPLGKRRAVQPNDSLPSSELGDISHVSSPMPSFSSDADPTNNTLASDEHGIHAEHVAKHYGPQPWKWVKPPSLPSIDDTQASMPLTPDRRPPLGDTNSRFSPAQWAIRKMQPYLSPKKIIYSPDDGSKENWDSSSESTDIDSVVLSSKQQRRGSQSGPANENFDMPFGAVNRSATKKKPGE